MKKLILLLAIAFNLQPTLAQQTTSINWNTDLDFLANELSKKHNNFFTVRSPKDLRAGIEAIKSKSGEQSDFQTALKTQQLLASFGDSHTSLNFTQLFDQSQILPFQVVWISDGLYIDKTTAPNKDLLGQRLLAINGTPVATVIDSLSTLFTIDNRAVIKSKAPMYIGCLQILSNFGFTDTEQAELTLSNGKTRVLKPAGKSPTEIVSFKPDSLCFSAANKNVFFTDRYFPDEKIYYMLYNVCGGREVELAYGNAQKAATQPSFEEFAENAFQTLKTQNIDKIVFDMRNNGGGSSSQGTQFIKLLAAFLTENPHISTYVVTGRRTFSSAILNCMDFKQLTNAIFVGEETAGKPNHFGEVRSFQLPSSRLGVMYSTKYFKRSDQNISTLTPDVPIESSFEDYAKGIDPVFEWIKNQK